jgi:hypothetical protein
MSVENPTPGEIRTNHERVRKAVAALNGKDRSGMTRYVAVLPDGEPGAIEVEHRPYNSRKDEDFTFSYRVVTTVADRQGAPVSYSNEFSGNHQGTMTYRVYRRGKTLAAKRDGLRAAQNRVEKARAELEAAIAAVASREAEIERLRGGESSGWGD